MAENASTEPRLDRTKIAVYKKGEEPSDVLYWLSRPPAERLLALETIRAEYNLWHYGSEQGFQRVYRVIKRKKRKIPRDRGVRSSIPRVSEIHEGP